MIENLKKYCLEIVDFTSTELDSIENYFTEYEFDKNDFLLSDGEVCNFIGFLLYGCIRHFHIKDGHEITCDISFDSTLFLIKLKLRPGIIPLISPSAHCRSIAFQAKSFSTSYLEHKPKF